MNESDYLEKIRKALAATFKEEVSTDEVLTMLRSQGVTAEQYWAGLLEVKQAAANYKPGLKVQPDKETEPLAYSQWLKDTQAYEYWPLLADSHEPKK